MMEGSAQISPEALQAILQGPSTVPPEGVVPNFDNPSNGNAGAIALAVICISLATIAGLLRSYSRIFVMKQIRVEDFLGLSAFGFYAGTAWCYFRYVIDIGFFVHQWDLRASKQVHMAYIVFILDIVYQLTVLLAKTAILLEWTRIFAPHRIAGTFYWASRSLMVVNILFYLASIISVFLTCTPFERIFHFWVNGTCIDQKARDISVAIFNLVLDIFIFVLPQRVIWNLAMDRKRKVGISLVFSVGLLVCVSAAGRLASAVTVQYPKDNAMTYDSSFIVTQVLLWVIAEQTCILLVFCVPAIPKLFGESNGGRLLLTLRSWSRLLSTSKINHDSRGVNDDNGSWALRTIGSTPSRGLVYRNIDKHAGSESLAELGVMRAKYTQEHRNDANDWRSDSGIVKTTEVDQCQDHAHPSSVDPSLGRQHPWMEPGKSPFHRG